ncbi:MAG TPA: hypothetical protein IAA60_07710 [Candidatus Ornithomonoglobus intestinigallinarum]|uniref:GLUG domain-containing protein n=1 Tax=Candidatus Ornithomonoglobus intestinigallinarum TaxID=2840894 RepID=A0A9D1KRM4_9FIRM|nr:hypothetical protein [Candidatus Ornithomonoglobus intestinigallinarum]
MKVRNMVSALLVPVIMACTVQISFAAEWRGSGTKDDPYLISSADDWSKFRKYVNGDDDGGAGEYWKLTADIDFKQTESQGWIAPVGKYDVGAQDEPAEGKMFQGNFDGDGHVVKNYTIDAVKNELGNHGAFGLFSAIGGDAVIENLGAENVTLRMGADHIYISAGAVAGTMIGNAKITNCYSKNVICDNANPEGQYITSGGLAGSMYDSASVINSYGRLFTPGKKLMYYGGIVGGIYSQAAVIQNCYSDTSIAVVSDCDWNNSWYNLYYVQDMTKTWPGNRGSGNGWFKDGKTGYIGTRVTEAELKAVPNELRANFIADDGTNDGWPILRPLTVKMTRTTDEVNDGRVGFYIEEMYLPAYKSVVVDYTNGTGGYPLAKLIEADVNSNVTFGLQINDVPEIYRNDISVSLSKREVSGK